MIIVRNINKNFLQNKYFYKSFVLNSYCLENINQLRNQLRNFEEVLKNFCVKRFEVFYIVLQYLLQQASKNKIHPFCKVQKMLPKRVLFMALFRERGLIFAFIGDDDGEQFFHIPTKNATLKFPDLNFFLNNSLL